LVTKYFGVSLMVFTKADDVLKRIEEKAERRFLPIIGPDKGRILADVTRRIKPKRILEVGTLVGYSAIIMAKELESDAEIITIEINEAKAETAQENIKAAEVKPKVKVLVGDALDIIPKLKGKFNLVFLDATKSEYLDYLKLVEDKLDIGSVIVADNAGIFAYSMREYLDYVRNSERYESRFIPVNGDGLEVSTRL